MLDWIRGRSSREDTQAAIKNSEKAIIATIKALESNVGKRLVAIERKTAATPATKLPCVSFSRLPPNNYSCPTCLSSGIEHAAAYPSNNSKFRSAIVLYCAECGTGFVPDADSIIESYYKVEYATANRKDRDMPPEQYFNQTKPDPRYGRYFARASAQMKALTAHGANFDRVLDYGSGPGYFLYVSKAKQKFAVELDESSQKYLDYIGATRLSHNDLGHNAFDVILASHVVEHFTNTTLEENLTEMSNALSVGGHLLIEVPQGGHSFSVLETKQDPHTLFFTPEGIYRAIKRQGLTILDAYPRGVTEAPPHPSPIYSPGEENPFFTTRRGGLTVIAQKAT
jgi:SAM-dependent methyltransferase